MAHKIYTCVYPSNLDRQNVQYTVNIFHENNDVTLQNLIKILNPNDWEGTQQLLKIIRISEGSFYGKNTYNLLVHLSLLCKIN